MKSITHQMAQFALGLQYEDIPAGAVREAKRVLLDSVGCALAAVPNVDMQAAHRHIPGLDAGPKGKELLVIRHQGMVAEPAIRGRRFADRLLLVTADALPMKGALQSQTARIVLFVRKEVAVGALLDRNVVHVVAAGAGAADPLLDVLEVKLLDILADPVVLFEGEAVVADSAIPARRNVVRAVVEPDRLVVVRRRVQHGVVQHVEVLVPFGPKDVRGNIQRG